MKKTGLKATMVGIGLALVMGLTPAWAESPAPVSPQVVKEKPAQAAAVGVLTGSATVIRNGTPQKLTTAEKGMEILGTDKVLLAKGEACSFSFPDGRRVKLSGEGEYSLQNGEIRVFRGGLMVSFSSSPKGYKVRLPTATLGIRGTILHILVDGLRQCVWVDEGIIEYENDVSHKTGILKTKEGLTFEGKNQKSIKSSPFIIKSDDDEAGSGDGSSQEPDNGDKKPEKKPVEYIIQPPFGDNP